MHTSGPVAQLVSVPPCHGGGRGFKSRQGRSERRAFLKKKALRVGSGIPSLGSVAQLVERSTENRKVTGSTPVGATEPSRGFYSWGFFSFPGFSASCLARGAHRDASLRRAFLSVCAGFVPVGGLELSLDQSRHRAIHLNHGGQ